MPRYLYGMRHLRGFGPGCQPARGLISREDDPAGRYNDVLVYDRELEPHEIDSYELDFMGAEPDTTTHESNVVKKGGNDEDRTSDDCISRTQAIDTIKKRLFETAFNNIGIKRNVDDTLLDVAEDRLETWFDDVPPIQTDIIRCKDCAYCDSDVVDAPYGMTKKIFWCDRLYAGTNENLVVDPDDFCSWAERREDAID